MWNILLSVIKKRLENIFKKNIFIYIMIGCYFGIVLWLTIFNREPSYKANVLPPFWSYRNIAMGDLNFLKENIENIFLFIPIGYFLNIYFNKNFKKIFLCSFILSFLIETIQIITTLGIFEFDDLLHNSIGAIIGFYIYTYFPLNIVVEKKFFKRIVLISVVSILVIFKIFVYIVDYIHYQKMLFYSSLNDSSDYKNILVLDGKNDYVYQTNVYVEYMEDGSIHISGTSDAHSWYQIGSIELESGTYIFTGLSDVMENTVGLELEYYDDSQNEYMRMIPDIGPIKEIEFTLYEKTKIKVYVVTYENITCDVIARPAIYMKE